MREAEDKYPSQRAMEDLAVVSNLTFKQVRGWFIEKRRSEKSKNELIEPPRLTKKLSVFKGRKGAAVASDARKMLKQLELSASSTDKSNKPSSSKYKHAPSEVQGRIGKRKKKLVLVQDLLTSDYILGKIFRKDGPALGLEFDSLPTRAFHGCEGKTFALTFFYCCLVSNGIALQISSSCLFKIRTIYWVFIYLFP